MFGSEFAQCSVSRAGIGFVESMMIARLRCVAQETFFQASHVKLLAREVSLPQFVLLHVDLSLVLRGIDSSYWPRSLRKRELLNEGRDEKGNG